MIDWLKGLIPDEMNTQLETELQKHGDKVKLGNLAGGAYVGKEKHDEVASQLKTAKETIAQREADLATLKALKPEELQAKIAQLEAKNAADATAANEKFAALQYDNALTSYASGIRFTSELAKDAFLGKMREAKLQIGTDGKLIGADDIAKQIREKNPTAFEPEKKGGPGFGTPGAPKGDEPVDRRAAISLAMYGH